MDTTQIIVTGVGAVLMLMTAKFFLTSSKGTAMSASIVGGTQQQRIQVKGGYSPNVVHVNAGTPVQLIFDRQETSSCSSELVIPEFGIRRDLPAHEQTTIEFTPTTAGEYSFTCGMNMLRGTIVVE